MADTVCRIQRITERQDPDNDAKVLFQVFYECDFAPGVESNVTISADGGITLMDIAGAIPTEDDITWE